MSSARAFYRFPSVEITYFFSALLFFQLFFIVFHLIGHLRKETKKGVFTRGTLISEVLYVILFLICIFLSYYQQNDSDIAYSVFGLELLILFNDFFFTSMRSALYTSKKIIFKSKNHKILLAFNILCLISAISLGGIGFGIFRVNQKYRQTAGFLGGFAYLIYLTNQITNIVVFLYIVRILSNVNDSKIEVGKMKLYTSNLVLSGLISKGYLLTLNLISGDLIFPWSQAIFDGNLLCLYFMFLSWPKMTRVVKELVRGRSSTTQGNSYSSGDEKRNSVASQRKSTEVVTLESLSVVSTDQE